MDPQYTKALQLRCLFAAGLWSVSVNWQPIQNEWAAVRQHMSTYDTMHHTATDRCEWAFEQKNCADNLLEPSFNLCWLYLLKVLYVRDRFLLFSYQMSLICLACNMLHSVHTVQHVGEKNCSKLSCLQQLLSEYWARRLTFNCAQCFFFTVQ